ncbi:MAG: phosphopantothenoylcysteine decarboxylase [Chitinophagales bacterium]|nr:phosphopantothenoylcysteine decarboxylase [Sphingobacteriales bacterium]
MSALKGVQCLVTAGPTYEAIDPVRYIGNRSSGKMGIAIAEELSHRGAQVTLILGPSSISVPESIGKIIRVESSDEMYQAAVKVWSGCQLGVFAAAVADYKPKEVANQKIKKLGDTISIELVKTSDILQFIGKSKGADQILVGFALETQNELENAKQKIAKKNLDMIVLNSLNDKGAGFQYDTNRITLIDSENKITKFELKTKREVAIDIVNSIESKYFS